MKKIIVSISVVIVALAMIFGLPAWEKEESPTAAEKMAEDQHHETAANMLNKVLLSGGAVNV